MSKPIWIDLENSPHVLFFHPIIRELEQRGHRLLITARDAYNVLELLDRFDLDARRVGRHHGKNLVMKGAGLMWRALQLSRLVLRHRPSVAVAHGSRSQVTTAYLLGIPSLSIVDYEHGAGWGLPWVRPTATMFPEVIPKSALGNATGELLPYPGIKEDVYVWEAQPDPSIYPELGLSETDLIVTVRPPATSAHYYVEASGDVFSAAMDHLLQHPEVKIVLLPRTSEQDHECRSRWSEAFQSGRVLIPDRAVDGINLCLHSDLVVSGGGTMNREAATLGIPVYSIFQGSIGAVDRYLSEQGRLVLIRGNADVARLIKVERREKGAGSSEGDVPPALTRILEQIEKMARER